MSWSIITFSCIIEVKNYRVSEVTWLIDSNKFEDIVSIASQDTEKASRIIAKSFYKVLRKNGFTDNQIITIASDILGCLLESLEGYREKKRSEKED